MTTQTRARRTPKSPEAPPVPHAPDTAHAPDAPVAPAVLERVQEVMRRPYRMVIQGDPDEGYLARVPELPHCMTAGETPEEALGLLRDAMEGWLIVAIEHGNPIPEPAPLPDAEYSGKFVLRVPKSLHRQLVQRADEEGVSLNQLCLNFLASGMGAATATSSRVSASQDQLKLRVVQERL